MSKNNTYALKKAGKNMMYGGVCTGNNHAHKIESKVIAQSKYRVTAARKQNYRLSNECIPTHPAQGFRPSNVSGKSRSIEQVVADAV